MCAGINSVTVIDNSGSISTGTVTVTSLSTIVTTDTSTNATCPTCTDGSATINNTSGGTPPYNYLWSNGATTNTIDSLLQGTYTVTVTDNNGCVFIDSITVGFDVGTEQLIIDHGQLIIYPNPVTDELTIESTLQIAKDELTDITGRILLQQKENNKRTTLSLTLLPTGIYFIKLTMTDGSVTVKRIVKE